MIDQLGIFVVVDIDTNNVESIYHHLLKPIKNLMCRFTRATPRSIKIDKGQALVRDNVIKILECHSIYKKLFKEKSSTDIITQRISNIMPHSKVEMTYKDRIITLHRKGLAATHLYYLYRQHLFPLVTSRLYVRNLTQ